MAPSKLLVEDSDPVEKEFDVYITSPLDASTRLYLLQHPTRDRDQAYNAFNETTPLELRIKPETGFVELDVPINTNINYNEAKALQWGAALEQTKKDGGFGIASGLALAPASRTQGRGRERGISEGEVSAPPVEKGMQRQTLGGQILSRERGTPVYMIGAFQGDKLHLTPLSGLVQMRPQFHHLDALTVAERQSRARTAAEGQAGRAASKGVPADATQPAPGTKAVLSTTKITTNDNEDASASNTKQLLEQAQTESWTKLRYFDEEEQEAYDAYAERLFLPGVDDDATHVARLASTMSNDEYLDAISAPRNDPHGKVRAAKQARAGRKSREHVEVSDGSESEAVEDEDEDDDDNGDEHHRDGNNVQNGGDVDMPDAPGDEDDEPPSGKTAARTLRSRG